MKKHGMDVMSLEEFEPNREFVGRYPSKIDVCVINCRNWNAGENVELVLKSLSGEWLPFTMVLSPSSEQIANRRFKSTSRESKALTFVV